MRSVAAGVVLVVAAVSGCSAGDAAPAEVGPLASGTADGAGAPSGTGASQSVAPVPGNKPSTTAPNANPDRQYPATVDGASAFAREYVMRIGQGFSEARSDAVRERSAPGCEGCEALMGAMEQAAADGLRRRGGEYVVTSVATPPFEDGDVLVLLTYTRGPSEIVDAHGTVVDRVPGVPETTVQMRLVHRSGGWLTQGYRVV